MDDTSPNKQEAEKNKEYQEFVDKFKPKKTTDDCYTPPSCMKPSRTGPYKIDTGKAVPSSAPSGLAVITNPTTTPTAASSLIIRLFPVSLKSCTGMRIRASTSSCSPRILPV